MIRRDPRVYRAVIEQAEWIALDSMAAAERFLTAFEDTIYRLHESPGMGRPWEHPDRRMAGLRRWSVKGFPNHVVFYRPVSDGIEVVHLVHAARNLGAALEEL